MTLVCTDIPVYRCAARLFVQTGKPPVCQWFIISVDFVTGQAGYGLHFSLLFMLHVPPASFVFGALHQVVDVPIIKHAVAPETIPVGGLYLVMRLIKKDVRIGGSMCPGRPESIFPLMAIHTFSADAQHLLFLHMQILIFGVLAEMCRHHAHFFIQAVPAIAKCGSMTFCAL